MGVAIRLSHIVLHGDLPDMLFDLEVLHFVVLSFTEVRLCSGTSFGR